MLDPPSCTSECIGPTPPSILGSWFFLMSFSHSLRANATSFSVPSILWGIRFTFWTSIKWCCFLPCSHMSFRLLLDINIPSWSVCHDGIFRKYTKIALVRTGFMLLHKPKAKGKPCKSTPFAKWSYIALTVFTTKASHYYNEVSHNLPVAVVQAFQLQFGAVELRQTNKQPSECSLLHIYSFALVIQTDWHLRREDKVSETGSAVLVMP